MYTVDVSKKARKQLKRLPNKDSEKLRVKIRGLSNDPHPRGSIKLKDKDQYRIRQGDYRIVYEVKDDVLLVLVIEVDHRKDVYMGM